MGLSKGARMIPNLLLEPYYEMGVENFIKTPFATAKLPCGMSIKAHQNWRNPSREKYRKLIPDNAKPVECKAILANLLTPGQRMTGIDKPRQIGSIVNCDERGITT